MERISVSRLRIPFPHVYHKGVHCINPNSIRIQFLHPLIKAALLCCGFVAATLAAFK